MGNLAPGNCRMGRSLALPCSPEAAQSLAYHWQLQEEGEADDAILRDIQRYQAQDPADPHPRVPQAVASNFHDTMPDAAVPLTGGMKQPEKEEEELHGSTKMLAASCTTVVIVLSLLLFAALTAVTVVLPAAIPHTVTSSTSTTSTTSTRTVSTTTSTTATSTITTTTTTGTHSTTTRTVTTLTTTATTTTTRTTVTSTSTSRTTTTPTAQVKKEGGGATAGAAASTSPTTPTTTTTTLPPPKDLELSMTVQHLDYSRLKADTKLLGVFKRTLQVAIAYEVGDTSPQDVMLSLEAGSVSVSAVVPDLPAATADKASKAIKNSDGFRDKLTSSISHVHGIGVASTGAISISDMAASSVAKGAGRSLTRWLLIAGAAACFMTAVTIVACLCCCRRRDSASSLATKRPPPGQPSDPAEAKDTRTLTVSPAVSPGTGEPEPPVPKAGPKAKAKVKAKAKATVAPRAPAREVTTPGRDVAPQASLSSRQSSQPASQAAGAYPPTSSCLWREEAAWAGLGPGPTAPLLIEEQRPAPAQPTIVPRIRNMPGSGPATTAGASGPRVAPVRQPVAGPGVRSQEAVTPSVPTPGVGEMAVAAALAATAATSATAADPTPDLGDDEEILSDESAPDEF